MSVFLSKLRSKYICGLFLLGAISNSTANAGPLSWAGDAASAIDLTVSGAHRTRYETILDGGANEHLFSLRTNILVEAGFENFRIGGELMDSRAYNPSNNNLPFTFRRSTEFINTIEPIQYYLTGKFEDVGFDGLDITLKGGRFTLDIGSGRLFGRNRFRNTVNTFRGGQITFEQNDKTLRLFYAQPLIIDNSGTFGQQMDTPRTSIDLWGAHYEYANLLGDISAETYLFVEQYDGIFFGIPENPRFIRFTPGLRVWRTQESGAFDFEIEATPQFSQHPQGFGYFGHVELGYEVEHSWRPHIGILFDIASGNGEPFVRRCTAEDFALGFSCGLRLDSRGTRSFNTLYGRLSDDFGPTGLFRSNNVSGGFGSRNIGRSNIISPGIRLSSKPTKNLSTQITYRGFWREDPNLNPINFSIFENPIRTLNSEVGHQVDANLSYALFDGHVELHAGAAIFFFGAEPNSIRREQFCGGGNVLDSSFCFEPISSRNYLYTSATVNF